MRGKGEGGWGAGSGHQRAPAGARARSGSGSESGGVVKRAERREGRACGGTPFYVLPRLKLHEPVSDSAVGAAVPRKEKSQWTASRSGSAGGR